jgi:uncharacterized membrane protein YgcG
MLTPEKFHDMLWDYIYDLLDDAEARQVQEYVAANPEARRELERSRKILASASRTEFPGVEFAPPVDKPVAMPATKRPIVAARGRSSHGIMRWAVAASLLILLIGGGAPLTQYLIRYSRASSQLESANLELAEAHRAEVNLIEARNKEVADSATSVRRAQDQITERLQRRNSELEEAKSDAEAKQLVLTVTGPSAIQAGAPTDFIIATNSKAEGNPITTRLGVRILDDLNNTLYEEKDVHSQGIYMLHVPPDLSYQPDRQLFLDVTASSEEQVRGELNERIPWSAPRYVTNIVTDKSVYQPGETVHFRSLTLNRATLQPPDEDFHLIYTVTSPSGTAVFHVGGAGRLATLGADHQIKPVLGPDQKPVRGVGAGDFVVPDTFEIGEYTLSVREENNRFAPEKMRFVVNKYSPDRFAKQVEFDRSSYGPGDEVVANGTVTNGQNVPLAKSVFEFQWSVDQISSPPVAMMTDDRGQFQIRFRLPPKIEKGNASLFVTFRDMGAAESIQKQIPIALKTLLVNFYPESGDLVDGLSSRVYFKATTTLGEPADLKGRLLDSQGREVAQVETLHDREPGANRGLGVFRFTPKAGQAYALKIDEPVGIESPVPMLSIKFSGATRIWNDGVVMSIPSGVTRDGEPIHVELQGNRRPRHVLLGAYCRGRLLDQQRVTVKPGKIAHVDLKPAAGPGGVVRVTAFEELDPQGTRRMFIPRAERLVFRKSSQQVRFEIAQDKASYAPRDKAKLTISAKDELGRPVSALALISVVNQAALTMADDKSTCNLPTYFALAGEVRRGSDLENAEFLLSDHPKATTALDMLLGVQGWRRFAEQRPRNFRQRNAADPENSEEAERILVWSGQAGQRVSNSLVNKHREIETRFAAEMTDLKDQLRRASDQDIALNNDPRYPLELRQKSAEIARCQLAVQSADSALHQFDETNRMIQRSIAPVVASIAIVASFAMIAIGLLRGLARGARFYLGAAASLTAGILLLVFSGIVGFDASESGKQFAEKSQPTGAAPTPMPKEEKEPAHQARESVASKSLPAAAPSAPSATRESPSEAAPAPAPPPPMARPSGARSDNDRGRPGGFGGGGGLGGGQPEAGKGGQVGSGGRSAPTREPSSRRSLGDKYRDVGKANPGPQVADRALPPPGAAGASGSSGEGPKLEPKALRGVDKSGKDATKEPSSKKKDSTEPQGAADKQNRDVRPDAIKQTMAPPAVVTQSPNVASLLRRSQSDETYQRRLQESIARAAIQPPAKADSPKQEKPNSTIPKTADEKPRRDSAHETLGLDLIQKPAPEPFIIREYAPVQPSDFVSQSKPLDTIYWNPMIVFDQSGKATIQFQLGNGAARYRIIVAGHALEGRLGELKQFIEAMILEP